MLNECERYCAGNKNCWGCHLHCSNYCQWNAISGCGDSQELTRSTYQNTSQKPGKER